MSQVDTNPFAEEEVNPFAVSSFPPPIRISIPFFSRFDRQVLLIQDPSVKKGSGGSGAGGGGGGSIFSTVSTFSSYSCNLWFPIPVTVAHREWLTC
ncbi:hypothetical protein V6N11_082969 [Hibiscus sabdariffa]|uniref:Uncharacterized protein n=1 Tax=Hibiscus sabdariffa TaxID=183260 RepID=A0ABR2QKH7_9ROSI